MLTFASDKPILLKLNTALSLVFGVFSVVALWHRPSLDGAYVGFCLLVFLVGLIALVAALIIAISASRFKQISLAGVFFLGHGAADASTRNWFIGLLCFQTVVSIAVAVAAPFSSIVFAVLVPQVGFGLMGLQGALHGKFEPLP